MARAIKEQVIDRRLSQDFSSAFHEGVVGTVAERLTQARKERAAKVAFAQKLTAAPKRRK